MMELCLAIGTLDVDGEQEKITALQFNEWKAFRTINPFGAGADTRRFAMQQANILNASHYSTGKVRLPTEFMPVFKKKPQTIEQQIAMIDRFA